MGTQGTQALSNLEHGELLGQNPPGHLPPRCGSWPFLSQYFLEHPDSTVNNSD